MAQTTRDASFGPVLIVAATPVANPMYITYVYNIRIVK